MIDCGVHLYQRIMKDNHHHFYLSPNDEVLFDENKKKSILSRISPQHSLIFIIKLFMIFLAIRKEAFVLQNIEILFPSPKQAVECRFYLHLSSFIYPSFWQRR